MLKITQVDHLGIRISDIARSRAFYERLGFAVVRDAGYEDGHPVVMVHPSGVVVNLLGPSTAEKDTNMLMDVTDKYSGYTHAALRVESIDETVAALGEMGHHRRPGALQRRHGLPLHPRPRPQRHRADRARRPRPGAGLRRPGRTEVLPRPPVSRFNTPIESASDGHCGAAEASRCVTHCGAAGAPWGSPSGEDSGSVQCGQR
jgi:catechol 2,3-dioxygenase-like lactoylglutathione lyase family enzyme